MDKRTILNFFPLISSSTSLSEAISHPPNPQSNSTYGERLKGIIPPFGLTHGSLYQYGGGWKMASKANRNEKVRE